MLKMIRAAALGMFALVMAAAVQAEAPLEHVLNMTGHGEVVRAPDLVIVSLGVTSNAASAKQALSANTNDMKKVMAAIAAAGVAQADVQTSGFTLAPHINYSNDGQPPKTEGFDVSNLVTIRLRKVEMLGEFLDTMVQAGSNQINTVQFALDNLDAALDEARLKAVDDAKRKAELFAKAANVKLGKIIALNEMGAPQSPIIYSAKARMTADAVPIAQGEQTISMDVTIVWTIE